MTTNPWLVPITAMRRSLGARRQEERVGTVGELRVAESVIPPGALASADAILVSVDGGIEVSAVVTAPWTGECRRCLASVEGDLRCEVREVYRPRRTEEDFNDGDDDTYRLQPDHLDLQPLVRDALLLELPLAPLCHEGCLGLCPSCGADRNTDGCGCSTGGPGPGFGRLDIPGLYPGDAPRRAAT